MHYCRLGECGSIEIAIFPLHQWSSRTTGYPGDGAIKVVKFGEGSGSGYLECRATAPITPSRCRAIQVAIRGLDQGSFGKVAAIIGIGEWVEEW